MNSPEDEIPMPSKPVLSDADIACEAIDKLASECRLNPTAYQREAKERVRQLERDLVEANERIKVRTKRLHESEQTCHEWCVVASGLAAERDKFKSESEIVRRVFGLPDNIALEASLTAYRDDYAALKVIFGKPTTKKEQT